MRKRMTRLEGIMKRIGIVVIAVLFSIICSVPVFSNGEEETDV